MEVSCLFAEMVQHGLRCITFCKTRKLCELVLSYTYVKPPSRISDSILNSSVHSTNGLSHIGVVHLLPYHESELILVCFDLLLGVKFFKKQHPIWLTPYAPIELATLLRSLLFSVKEEKRKKKKGKGCQHDR